VSEARGGPDPVGLACAAATALTWGLVGPLVRAIPALTPVELVAGRLAFGLAALLPALAARRARADLAEAARAPAAWALAALLVGYYVLAVEAFRLAPVADVALLIATAPLCALGLRRLSGGGRPGPRELRGAAVALAGVAVTLIPSIQAAARHAGGGARVAGDLLALASAATSAAYARTFSGAQARAAAGGRAAPAAFGVAVLTFALGTALLAARAALAGEPVVRAARLDGRGWALLAVFGVVSTFVPTLAFATAARRLPPVLTSAALLLVPVASAAAAAAVLGERPSPWLVPGGLLVGVGLLMLVAGDRAADGTAVPSPGGAEAVRRT
jgi:drug/metabolite transporter (DMT)-like permease